MNLLNQHIEALIFCSEQSISLSEIAASLKLSYDWEPSKEELLNSIEQIRERYKAEEFAFELADISEGYQFLTKKDYHTTISGLIQHKSRKKLSVSQMETLSIIAYKQPITKSEIEHIRGVNCDYAVQKLLEKELVAISGKSDGPGRPVLYTTSETFMDYFGIRSVKDLPQLKDIHMEQNEIGSPGEMSEGGWADSSTETEVSQGTESTETQTEPETTAVQMEVEESTIIAETDLEGTVDREESSLVSEETKEDDGTEGMELPDRKTIYLESESTANEEELSPDPRDPESESGIE